MRWAVFVRSARDPPKQPFSEPWLKRARGQERKIYYKGIACRILFNREVDLAMETGRRQCEKQLSQRFAREVKARVNEYFEKTGCRGTPMGR
jgi:hypothetical protein